MSHFRGWVTRSGLAALAMIATMTPTAASAGPAQVQVPDPAQRHELQRSRDGDRIYDRTLVIKLILEPAVTQESPTSDRPKVGDVRVAYGTSIEMRTGRPFGTWSSLGTLVNVEQGSAMRHVAGIFDTPYGQITAMGLDPLEGVRTFAITGGTGGFVGASGVIDAVSGRVAVFTVTVADPHALRIISDDSGWAPAFASVPARHFQLHRTKSSPF